MTIENNRTNNERGGAGLTRDVVVELRQRIDGIVDVDNLGLRRAMSALRNGFANGRALYLERFEARTELSRCRRIDVGRVLYTHSVISLRREKQQLRHVIPTNVASRQSDRQASSERHDAVEMRENIYAATKRCSPS